MKILTIAPTPFFSDRGCHIRIAEQALMLQKKGHLVRIVTYGAGRDLSELSIERTSRVTSYDEESVGFSFNKLILDALLFFKIISEIKKERPDMIHAHLHEGFVIGSIAGYLFGVKTVFDCQGSLRDELLKGGVIREGAALDLFVTKVEKFIYHCARFIIVSNESNRSELINRFNVLSEKVSVISDGITEEPLITGCDTTISSLQQLNKKEFVVVYAGTLSSVEGVDMLIKVAAAVGKKRGDIKIIVAGYPLLKDYIEQVKDNPHSNIRFIGRLNYACLRKFLEIGDIAISLKLPTTEGNLKLLHYSMALLPIVCFEHAANRNIIGDNALYLNPSASAEEIADVLIGSINNINASKKVAAEAKKISLQNYSLDKIIDKLIQIYGYF